MRHTMLPNGNLKITAGNRDRESLAYELRERGYYGGESYVAEAMRDQLTFIRPECIGALTEAPILTDEADYSEEVMEQGEGGPIPYPDAHVWWFPDYAIRDPWEELSRRGYVEFQAAPKD